MRAFVACVALRFNGGSSGVPVGAPHGTRGFMDPHIMLSNKANSRSDVFSLGAVLFFCATGGQHPQHVNVLSGDIRPQIPRDVDARIAEVIARCLQLDHKLRPSAEDLLPILKQRRGGRSSDLRRTLFAQCFDGALSAPRADGAAAAAHATATAAAASPANASAPASVAVVAPCSPTVAPAALAAPPSRPALPAATDPLTLSAYNEWRASRTPATRQPAVSIEYMSRSGMTHQVTAFLCCGVGAEQGCRCPSQAALQRWHTGELVPTRTTKTSATKTKPNALGPSIAAWQCCDKDAVTLKHNQDPTFSTCQFIFSAEAANGCQPPAAAAAAAAVAG